jgi:hypothetical protein
MRAVLTLALAAVACASCGTTYVVTTEPTARVYVDGAMVGKGQGTVTQRGFPGSAHVLVKTEDGRRQQSSLKRSFTATTFLLGLITYGVCWVACWEYPGSVLVDLPVPPGMEKPSPFTAAATPAVDPWLQPPPGWHPKKEAPPPAAEPASPEPAAAP